MAAEQKKAPLLKSAEDFTKNFTGYMTATDKIAVLLDYDGTLAPLTETQSIMPKDNELALKKLAANPNIFLAIISGRGLEDIKKNVKYDTITFAGNHGLEVEYPDKTKFEIEMPEELLEKYGKLVAELKEKVTCSGAWIEDKKIALTYHYKGVTEKLRAKLIADAKAIIKPYGFEIIDAHYAIEAKPPVNWDKGEAAKMILEKKFGEEWAKDLKVIYAGDDTTDEDAMKALKGIGKSVRVSEQPNLKTYADFQIKKPEEVAHLLNWINSLFPKAK